MHGPTSSNAVKETSFGQPHQSSQNIPYMVCFPLNTKVHLGKASLFVPVSPPSHTGARVVLSQQWLVASANLVSFYSPVPRHSCTSPTCSTLLNMAVYLLMAVCPNSLEKEICQLIASHIQLLNDIEVWSCSELHSCSCYGGNCWCIQLIR